MLVVGRSPSLLAHRPTKIVEFSLVEFSSAEDERREG